VIEVSRKKLESWLAHGKTVPGPVISGLKNHFKATETVGVDLAAGSGVAGGREKIISIPVPAGSPFEGVLLTNATAEDVLGKPNGKITAKVTAPAADGEQLALDLPLPAQIERTH
jgi:hypothetical protein